MTFNKHMFIGVGATVGPIFRALNMAFSKETGKDQSRLSTIFIFLAPKHNFAHNAEKFSW